MSRKFDVKNIKAIAIDLDGTTLLPDGILGSRTRDTLVKLISGGMQVIISTGRAIESSEKYRSAIGAEGPMVFFNGAEVADVPSGKILHTNLISLETAGYGAALAREMGIHYQIYLPAGISPDTGQFDPKQKWEALLIEKYGEEAEYYKKHTGITPVVKDLKNIESFPIDGCIKGMFIADPSLHDEVRKKMKDRFGEKITVMRSYPTFLEVINTGVSKGEGLRIAMEHRGLKPEEVIAFGDEENDLPMFSVAGFACAPKNAREKIREEADLIYGPHTEEGLAAWLEETFFKNA
ncbi:MAG: Cof-type HAD-IIB family hydrolase [Treponema sp.]|nr:Cof-type HAD-IIB family hydrolase [Treponema sp.]